MPGSTSYGARLQKRQGYTVAKPENRDEPPRAIISLGSNLGDSAQTLRRAAERIGQLPETELLSLSGTYISTPAGNPDQPDFYNAMLLATTLLSAESLLAALQNIEAEFGRVRAPSAKPSSLLPRTLDLDIIDIEGVVKDSPALRLPHPQTLLRDFVVTPLLAICPNAVLADGKVVNHRQINCGWIKAVLDEDGTVQKLDDCSDRQPRQDRAATNGLTKQSDLKQTAGSHACPGSQSLTAHPQFSPQTVVGYQFAPHPSATSKISRCAYWTGCAPPMPSIARTPG